MPRIPFLFPLLLLLFAIPAQGAEPLSVVVTLAPQKFLIERVGGEQVRVSVLVAPGQDPHTFEPTPRQMVGLSEANLFYRIGFPIEERWLPRLREINPAMTVFDARDGLPLAPMAAHGHGAEEGLDNDQDHDHGHDAEGAMDPHIWMSPALLMEMAGRIRDRLVESRPEAKPLFDANLERLTAELHALDAELHTLLDPLEHRAFAVFHPSWGYFATAYRLEQLPVEQGGKEPGPRGLAELTLALKREGIRVIFVQPQFSKGAVRSLAATVGARVAELDPLAEDVIGCLRATGIAIAGAARE